MPHFIIDTNEDGAIRQIFKNGMPHNEAVRLEQHFSIVKTYFKSAERNLKMLENQQADEDKRHYGLQSFLMAITGIEAFTNTYFHQRSVALGKPEMLKRIGQSHGSITQKIVTLLELSGDRPLHNQNELIERLYELTQLRNEIVHPRWEPSQISIPGGVWLNIEGLAVNRQALFEDVVLCKEVLDWCLLLVARVGQSLGLTSISGFMFRWTGQYGLTLARLLSDLGLPAEHMGQDL
jgi:hypothetical protein